MSAADSGVHKFDSLHDRISKFKDSLLLGVERDEAQELVAMILRRSYYLIVDLADDKIVYASPAVEKLFGYLEGELRGADVHSLVPQEQRDAHRQHFHSYREMPVTRQMGAMGMHLRGERKDGSTFPVEIGLHSQVLVSGRRVTHASIMPIRAP